MEHHLTFTGTKFGYAGSIASGIVVYILDGQGIATGTKVLVDKDTIDFIVKQIRRSGAIKMGACRDNPSKGSLGELLLGVKKSPQVLSYVLPLLEDKGVGLIHHYKAGRTFWVKCR